MARVRVGPHRSGAQCQIYGELDTQGGFIWSSQHRLRVDLLRDPFNVGSTTYMGVADVITPKDAHLLGPQTVKEER